MKDAAYNVYGEWLVKVAMESRGGLEKQFRVRMMFKKMKGFASEKMKTEKLRVNALADSEWRFKSVI